MSFSKVGQLLFLSVFLTIGATNAMATSVFTGKDALLETAIAANDSNEISKAIAAGAKINATGKGGETPVILAVIGNKPIALNYLLKLGADPNVKTKGNDSALSIAIDNYQKNPGLISILVKAGADPNTRRPDNDPVMMRFINDTNCEYIKLMKSLGANLDSLSRGNDPLITEAALSGDWDVVWCMIELGAKFDYEKTARSPLSVRLAAAFPAPDSPIYPYKVKVWEHLKKHGINVKPLPK